MEGSSSRATHSDGSMSISDIVKGISTLIDLVRAAKSAVPRPTASHVDRQLHKQLDLMKITLRYIETLFFDFQKNVNNQFKALRDQSDVLTQLSKDMPRVPDGNIHGTKPFCDDIRDITTGVMSLKLELVSTEAENNKVIKIRPANVRGLVNTLAKGPLGKFKHCPGYESFADNYEHLDDRSKRCLLSFSVFPEDATIPMTFLKYWWIGEGFIDDGEKTSKDVCVEILKDFTDKGFILPIFAYDKLCGFRMHPLTRCAVIFLAEESGFFSFDFNWNPAADSSSSEGAYLVKSEDGKSTGGIMSMDPRRVCRLLNVNDSWPELKSKWVSKMKSVKVASLGACTVDGRVEFQSREFLNELKDMKHVKFLSLRRSDGIEWIPNTINNLTDLKVLDLEDCPQLRQLPDDISFLKNLVHLNLEGCNCLRFMPEGLGSLAKLQVLKGYRIRDLREFKTFNDLPAHAKLSKLSIIIDNIDNAKLARGIVVVSRMETLKKLKITWRIGERQRSLERSPLFIKFPTNLEKIDLRDCPFNISPVDQRAWELSRLHKIYINGGDLFDVTLGLTPNERRNVKVLRLKKLSTYDWDSIHLQEAFPSLVYLEKIRCHGHSDPDEANGVWVDSEKLSELDVGELGLSCNVATKLPNRNVRSLRH